MTEKKKKIIKLLDELDDAMRRTEESIEDMKQLY
tara:strand:- start:4239 stop:4340 length:102 start_codon:yes stop_codon:yes gene_type:complete